MYTRQIAISHSQPTHPIQCVRYTFAFDVRSLSLSPSFAVHVFVFEHSHFHINFSLKLYALDLIISLCLSGNRAEMCLGYTPCWLKNRLFMSSHDDDRY